jgi:hypothetical protein
MRISSGVSQVIDKDSDYAASLQVILIPNRNKSPQNNKRAQNNIGNSF